MIRKVINIDENKCNGCGACANACHEGAIEMINGKAKLMRDDYCDGMGDCLPECPTGAITFTEREAAAYNEAAVAENKKKKEAAKTEKKENVKDNDFLFVNPNVIHKSLENPASFLGFAVLVPVAILQLFLTRMIKTPLL